MAPTKTKLIRHRWDMHAFQALAKRDPDELTRVFTELQEIPATALDMQVKTFGFGAPAQFHTFGFFDKASAAASTTSSALFDRVVDGDTLLLLALRHYDPKCASALVKLGASLHISNSTHENPLQVLFNAMAFFHRHPDDGEQDKHDGLLLEQQAEYEALFALLRDELDAFYCKQKSHVERELRELYQRFAPDRVSKIPVQLEAFAFREDQLLESAKKKYIL